MDLLILYITVGIALQGLVRPHVRFASRVITLLAWPVLLFLEGTPTMARFVEWAEKD
jgi:hypothetical protein